MKLELKHLAPYLPYGLKFSTLSDDDNKYYIDKERNTLDFGGLNGVVNICTAQYSRQLYKIVLRPLSDLTKEIEHNGEKFVPSVEFENLYLNDCKWGYNSIGTGIIGKNGFMAHLCFMYNEIIGECPLAIYELLIEWHFDIFGLIEKGLAVDINTLKK